MESARTFAPEWAEPTQTLGDLSTDARLSALLAANAEVAREKALYRNDAERLRAALMAHPVPFEKAFQQFGFLIGLLTPLAILVKMLIDTSGSARNEAWVLVLSIVVVAASTAAGYLTGKVAGRIFQRLNSFSVSKWILTAPFVGMGWGMAAGAIGGAFIFLIGAFFGAVFGGAVGLLTVPVFAALVRILKVGDNIERRHLLPLEFGITLSVFAFILGT